MSNMDVLIWACVVLALCLAAAAAGAFWGAFWQHKREVRRILSAGFWPLAKGFGDRRAEHEVRAQSLATRNDASRSEPRPTSRQRKARIRGRRVQ